MRTAILMGSCLIADMIQKGLGVPKLSIETSQFILGLLVVFMIMDIVDFFRGK